MEVKASLNYLRIAPRKVRLVANLIKGLSITKAIEQLKYNPKRTSKDIMKLLQSAKANAVHNFHIEPTNLFISKIMVSGGPSLKRMSPRAHGSAYVIKHRSSHIDITLKPIDDKLVATKEVKETVKEKKVRKISTVKKTHNLKTNAKASKGVTKNVIQRKVIGG